MEAILRSSPYLAVYRKVLVSVRRYPQIMKVSYLKFFKRHLPEAHAYTDDTQLYLSFQQDSAMSQADAVNALHSCIKDIRTWMIVDKLKLNDEKTELIDTSRICLSAHKTIA